MSADPTIFDRMSVLSDTTRSRLLLLLQRHELTVSELCAVLQLPQSTVSRHLRVLADGGWAGSRREGTSRLYRMTIEALEPAARHLWGLLAAEAEGMPAAAEDARRLTSVLAERRRKSQEFFSASAGEWDRLRRELFGEGAEWVPLLALLPEDWVVGDLGCGTGHAAEALAPFVRRVVAVDDSPAMLDAARRRLSRFDNVDLRGGALEALPVADGELDAAVAILVLHHLPEPEKALAEVARSLKPGGRLVIVDMTPHDREEYRQEMGHVWMGFAPDQLAGWLRPAGFGELRSRLLPADPKAKGPTLFAASARRAIAPPRPAGEEEVIGAGERLGT